MKNKFIFAVISGLLLALSFPPYPFPFLAFIGFVPILFYFDTYDIQKHKYLLLYILFFIFHAGTNWWIGSWQDKTDPYLTASAIALAIGHPFFFMIPFWAYFKAQEIYGKDAALWIFPWFWVAFEWLHSLGEFSYPWLTIGNTQIYNIFWIQFIDITGVWGASFLIVFINILILKIIYSLKELRETNSKRFLNKNSKVYLAILLVLIILPIIYGAFRIKQYNHKNLISQGNNINIGLIQPSINPWDKWEAGVIDQIFMHMKITDSINTASAKSLDLVIWSETAIPYYSFRLNAEHKYDFLTNWIDTSNFSLLTGFSEAKLFTRDNKPPTANSLISDTSIYYKMYNSALLVNPYPFNEDNPQLYQKMRLTPFAERFPYADQLTFAQDWMKWGVGISDWGIGKNQHTMKGFYKSLKYEIGSIICIESIYPGFCRGFTSRGANILSVITNDAWYNYTIGPEQHFLISQVRAIENRRYIARCANSGVTGFIQADGSALLKAEQYEAIGISATIPLLEEKSIYVLYGDWFPLMTLLISLSVLFFSRLLFKNREK